jgi:hypothetical protein
MLGVNPVFPKDVSQEWPRAVLLAPALAVEQEVCCGGVSVLIACQKVASAAVTRKKKEGPAVRRAHLEYRTL